MTSTLSTPPVRPRSRMAALPDALAPAAVVAAVLGIAIGVATCFLQGVLPGPFAALADAASPWLAGSFVAGAVARSPRVAAAAGVLSSLSEVAGYYVVTDLRGSGGSVTEIVFWSVCGALGGPLLGWAGNRWWRGVGAERALGAALLPACFAAEAIGTYAWQLHHYGSAVLFAAVAVVSGTALLGVAGRPRPVRRALAWFVVVTAIGAVLIGPVLNHLGAHVFTS